MTRQERPPQPAIPKSPKRYWESSDVVQTNLSALTTRLPTELRITPTWMLVCRGAMDGQERPPTRVKVCRDHMDVNERPPQGRWRVEGP